jgi:hypothetical protein
MDKLLRRVLPVFFLFLCCLNAYAQDSLKVNLKSNGRIYFAEGDYTKALPVYSELLRLFPREPEYMFSVAVCCVNLNRNLEEAIRLLRAVTVTEYSPLSWYYLGRAYHLYYSFEDAIKAYSKFMLRGKSSDIRRYNVERLIEMAKNGIEYTQTGRSIIVQKMQTILIDQLQPAGDINGSGKLMRKPAEFCSKTDIRNDYKPWMFLPSYTEINEYVYVAGYEQGKKNQKQLFRIKNINHETWGFAEPLKSLNTPYDEEFPFFDARTSTLYFSSKGHSSMGGYDIFKSIYDWNTKTWSNPENLGFPINSPFDDFAYITDELNHSASFVSTRDVSPNQAVTYKIRLKQDTAGIHFTSVDEIRLASRLSVEEKPVVTLQVAEKTDAGGEADSNLNLSVSIALPKNNYNQLLSEALILQVKADSSSRITRDLRIQARETPDNGEKKQLISEIIKSDKEAKSLQRAADSKFAEARKLKPADNTAHGVDSSVLLSEEVNGIRVYHYSESTASPETITENQIIPGQSQNIENTPSTLKIEEFKIEEKPFYSESNPIPYCSNTSAGLIYRIQLGVLSRPASNETYGGFSPVCYELVESSKMYKYYTGFFTTLNSVTESLEIVRAKGFPDAFIVAFFNGKAITTEKAKEIEFSKMKL